MTISVIKTAINMGPVWLFRLGKTGVNKKSTDWVIGKCECQWHHHKYFHYLQRKLTLANICLYVIYGVVRNSVFSSQMNVYHMPAPLLLFEWKAKSSSKKLFNTWMIKLYSQIMVLIYQYLWQKSRSPDNRCYQVYCSLNTKSVTWNFVTEWDKHRESGCSKSKTFVKVSRAELWGAGQM